MKIEAMSLPQLKKAYKASRKACGSLNKLRNSAFRTVQRSKLFSKMNKLRAAIKRAIGEFMGVIVNFTKKEGGFYFITNGVKSKTFATIADCMKCIEIFVAIRRPSLKLNNTLSALI